MAKRSYRQFCPVARTLDVLGERWTLLIVRELLTGPQRYTDLRERLPGMWSNLLAQRLRELEDAGLVGKRDLPPPAARTVYELTPRGQELEPVIAAIARFGLPYLDAPSDDEPIMEHLVPNGLKALVRLEELPDEGLVVGTVVDGEPRTLRIAPVPAGAPRPQLTERVAMEDGVADDVDVVLTTALPVLIWLRRGDAEWADLEDQDAVVWSGSTAARERVRRLLSPAPRREAA